MNSLHLTLIVLAGLLLLAIAWGMCHKESFEPKYTESRASNEFLQYLDMGDHRTMVFLQRGNSGKTILLLHNSPMNLNIWQPLFQTMQRLSMSGISTPNLVAYDLRGHGTAWMPVNPKYNDTNVKNTAWTLDQFVEDCKKVYEKVIGGGRIKLCGFGFGGKVAQVYAQKYPDSIEKLIILQATTSPSPGLNEEIQYLGGPTGWINQSPKITYLTSQESWIEAQICMWFYLPHANDCPDDVLLREDPEVPNDIVFDDEGAPQFNLTTKMYRQGSATTTLQVDKILANTDLAPGWKAMTNVPFQIHILAATDDPLAPPDLMTKTYANIYNTNREVIVVFDIVKGRHGFTIMHPDYIAGIICEECADISNATTFELQPYEIY